MADDATLPFRCEYAKSARSKCKACKKPIDKGEFRLAKMIKSPAFDGMVPSWFHPDCFFAHPKKRGMTGLGEIEGLAFARPEDQRKVETGLGIVDRGVDGSSVLSPRKNVPDGSALVWSVVEFLAARDDDLVALWTNDRASESRDDVDVVLPKSNDQLRNRVASEIVYGVPPICPDCGKDRVRRCSRGYRCSHLSEWGSCMFRSETIACRPFSLDATIAAELPEGARECLARPLPWVAVAFDRSNATVVEEDEPEEERRETNSWSAISFGGVTDVAKAKLSSIGARLLKTVPKTADASLLRNGPIPTARRDSAVLSLQSVESLADADATRRAFATLENFLKLAHPAGDDANLDRLRRLWKRGNESPVAAPSRATKRSSSPNSDERTEAKKLKLVFKGRAAVDPLAGVEYTLGWKVHDPPGSALPYDVVLNLADVASGTNSYYGLQVLEQEGRTSGPHALFRKWGRIGSDRGGSKVEVLLDAKTARKRFEALFLDKSGNSWDDRLAGKFCKQPGKFAPVEVARQEESEVGPLDATTTSTAHGLDDRVAALIGKLFDVQAIEASLREMEIDLKKMPLGNLTKATVERGYAVLREIETELKNDPSPGPTSDDPEEVASRRRKRARLVALSNKFYTLVPHDFGDQPPCVLDDEAKIAAKVELLDVLSEVEATMAILKRDPKLSLERVHPVRSRYDELKTELVPVEPLDERRVAVESMLEAQRGTHRVRLVNLYAVDREGEKERFASVDSQDRKSFRALLWHGSRLSNFGGILSRGLLIAPPSAPVSGYRLGKGVYFADVAEKSIGYAAPRSGQTILVLLCEVALGTPAELFKDKYMERPVDGHDSTHALGTLSPQVFDRWRFPQHDIDCMVATGKPVHRAVRSDFLHDEYVVYDVRRVRQRFLLEIQVS